MEDNDNFEWPPQYNFPPFFTIQPNDETRRHQFQAWSQLILDYCEENRIFVLDKGKIDIPLFHNRAIMRQLSVDAVEKILDDMQGTGKSEWVDGKSKDRCFIYWHTPQEWGNLIYDWAKSNGLLNTVETFFVILDSNTEFKGMDSLMLHHCLKTLEKNHKVEIIGEEGVKFFQ